MKTLNDDVLSKALKLRLEGKPYALATVVRVVSPTSAKPGAKAIVEPDGSIQGWIGGGCAQPAVIKTAKKVLKKQQPSLIRISPDTNEYAEEGVVDFKMICHSGGTMDIFIEPVIAYPSILVIGTSPVAQSLTNLASQIGYYVTIASTDIDKKMFAQADDIIDNFDVADKDAKFVVVATQGKNDERGLEAALKVGTDYVAFVASKTKVTKLKARLIEKGMDNDKVNNIISPAGIEINALTSEEIALSVLAHIVKTQRTHKTKNNKVETKKSGYDDKELVAIDPVCKMSVDIKDSEYNVKYKNKTYYFCCSGCQYEFEKNPKKYIK